MAEVSVYNPAMVLPDVQFSGGNTMKKYLIASAATLMTGSAFAADVVYEEAPVPVEVAGFTWSGFYAGVHGGYSWSDADFEASGGLPSAISVISEGDLDGFLVGLHTGVQHQFDSNIVLGVELDVDYRDGEDDAALTVSGTPTGVSIATEMNWAASARLRAGYAMDRWLPYVTGGFAIADYDAECFWRRSLPGRCGQLSATRLSDLQSAAASNTPSPTT